MQENEMTIQLTVLNIARNASSWADASPLFRFR
jgi:hypothetical protein